MGSEALNLTVLTVASSELVISYFTFHPVIVRKQKALWIIPSVEAYFVV